MHDHSIHILLISLQIIFCLLFLFRKKFNLKFLVVSILLFSLFSYTSSSRLIFAHHHQSQSDNSDHPCCQSLAFDFVQNNEFKVLENDQIIKDENGKSLIAFTVLNFKSIRSPPSLTA